MSRNLPLAVSVKSDMHVAFDTSTSATKPFSVEGMIQRIETLDRQDIAAGGQLLKNAIEKGQLLCSIKEQCQHGTWLFHLKTLSLHPRYAQRLMSLVDWNAALMVENRNRIAKTKRPLGVVEALRLVGRWNSHTQQTAQDDPTSPLEAATPFGIKAKGQQLIITWKVQLADLDTIIERIEQRPQQLTTQILAILNDYTSSQTDAKDH